jgi:hypothetical protein
MFGPRYSSVSRRGHMVRATNAVNLSSSALTWKPLTSFRPRIKCGINCSRSKIPIYRRIQSFRAFLDPGFRRGDGVGDLLFLKLTALGWNGIAYLRGNGVFSRIIKNYSGDNRVIINMTITKDNYYLSLYQF